MWHSPWWRGNCIHVLLVDKPVHLDMWLDLSRFLISGYWIGFRTFAISMGNTVYSVQTLHVYSCLATRASATYSPLRGYIYRDEDHVVGSRSMVDEVNMSWAYRHK